jgi:hypothetical protein
VSAVAASGAADARHASRRTWQRAATRGLDVSAFALAALLVLSFGLTDGGYYGKAYTELTVLLSAAALLAVVGEFRPRLSRGGVAVLGAMALLTVWVALSSTWAASGAAVALEVRRSVLYLVALAAVLVVVHARRRLPFLVGLLGAICAIGVAAVAMRVASGAPVDRLYGTLLEEPVGYPNALGVLVAMGAVLAVGLVPAFGDARGRVLGAATPFLVFVLGLTASRGGALALALGLGALVALSHGRSRRPIAAAIANAVVIGGAAWAFVQWRGAEGAALAALATATLAAGWLSGSRAGRSFPFRRRLLVLLACAVLAGASILFIFRTPTVTTSYRSNYWHAAIAEATEHPLLGSGAGSFYLSWREHRSVDLGVRDAHSLYVETLSELGPLGLTLVLLLVVLPLVVAVRDRGDPLAAAAGAAFLVFAAHAGVDWDWEMPVVTLAGLACAGVLLAGATTRDRNGHPTTGRGRPC